MIAGINDTTSNNNNIEGLNEEESAWVCRAVQTNAMGKSIDFEKDPAPSECAIEELLQVLKEGIPDTRIDKHQKE